MRTPETVSEIYRRESLEPIDFFDVGPLPLVIEALTIFGVLINSIIERR